VGVVVGVCAGVVLVRVVGWLRSWVIDGMPPPLGRLVFSRFWPLVLLAPVGTTGELGSWVLFVVPAGEIWSSEVGAKVFTP
jgi:hypothetical protein